MGLGFEGDLSSRTLASTANGLLSPMSATFPSKQYATLAPGDSISQRASPAVLYTPASATFPYTPASAASGAMDTDGPSLSGSENPNPFNFQSVTYQPGQPQAKSNVQLPPLPAKLILTFTGCWTKTRTQVQAQQCIAPDISRTRPARAPPAPRLAAHSDV